MSVDLNAAGRFALANGASDFRDDLTRPGLLMSLYGLMALALLPLWLATPIPVAATSITMFVLATWGRERLPRWLKILVVLAAVGLVLGQHRALLSRDAGLSLLVLMTSLKVLELRRYRDALLLCALAWFVQFAGLLTDSSLTTSLYLLLCMPLPLLVLLRLNRRFGARSWSQILRQLGRWLLLALPLLCVLYIFFPRLNVPLWQVPGSGTKSGVSDELTVGDISTLVLSDKPAFKAAFTAQIPTPAQRYWRTNILDEFDGITWRRSARRPAPEHLLAQTPALDYHIDLPPTSSLWLPVLEAAETAPQGSRLQRGHVAYSEVQNLRTRRYQGRAVMDYQLGADLSPAQLAPYLQLPAAGNPRARAYARDQRQRLGSDAAFVRFLQNTIHDQAYFYTLQPPELDEEIIDDFWFVKRRGFCEHYANAVSFLLRAAAIPARIVVGYQGGEWNPYGRYFQLRDRDAHAWLEYWQPDLGWQRLDPTAAIAPLRIEADLRERMSERDGLLNQAEWEALQLGAEAMFSLRQMWQQAHQWFDGNVRNFNQDTQRRWLEALGAGNVDWVFLLRALIIGLLLVLALVAAILLRKTAAKDPLTRHWSRFQKRMQRHDLHLAPGETPKAFAQRCARALPLQAASIQAFSRCYGRARYGEDEVASQRLPALLKVL